MIAPHRKIIKLREIIYSMDIEGVHNIMQTEKIGSENDGRDTISVMSAFSQCFSGHDIIAAHMS